MKAALAAVAAVALAGCIVTEDPSRPKTRVVEGSLFEGRCEEAEYAVALGCALSCRVAAGAGFQPAAEVLQFFGAQATYRLEEARDPTCGTLSFAACAENALGGLDCDEQSESVCLECQADALALVNDDETRRAVFPGEVVERSPLPAMMEGTFPGPAGACLSVCVARATGRCEGDECDAD